MIIECEEQSMKLEDGGAATEGRLEVCVEGIWGTVCELNYDKVEARITCRQLGFEGGSESLFSTIIDGAIAGA